MGELEIILKDEKGNRQVQGGDTVAAIIVGKTQLNQISSLGVLDLEDGSYLLEYVMTDSSQDYEVQITVNGQHLPLNYTISVLPANVSAS